MRSLDRQLISSIVAIGFAGTAILIAASAPQSSEQEDRQPQSAPEAPTAEIGHPAPDFTLNDQDGNVHHLHDYKGKLVIIEWFNPDCDDVKALHEKGSLKDYANTINREDDKVWLAVNSAQRDTPGWGEKVNQRARREFGFEFPILLDDHGEVARRYGAIKTPEVFIVDKEGVLRYRGAVDDDRGARKTQAGEVVLNYVRNAIEALDAGIGIVIPKTEPYGCDIEVVKHTRGGG